MSKTILRDVKFTPVLDELVQKYKITTALVFGKVWRYCQMKDGSCSASQARIAKELGIHRDTVNRAIKKLVKDGFISDTTPGLAGSPHVYKDTGKAGLIGEIEVEETDQEPAVNYGTSPLEPTEKIGIPADNYGNHPLEPAEIYGNLPLEPAVNYGTKIVIKKQLNQETSKDNLPDPVEPSSPPVTLSADVEEAWNFVLGQLQPEMGKANFETWVKPIKVREVAGKTYVLEVANGYAREWIMNRLQKRIEHILSGVINAECELVVLLPGETRMASVCAQMGLACQTSTQ